jgi:hypothetical protein
VVVIAIINSIILMNLGNLMLSVKGFPFLFYVFDQII